MIQIRTLKTDGTNTDVKILMVQIPTLKYRWYKYGRQNTDGTNTEVEIEMVKILTLKYRLYKYGR